MARESLSVPPPVKTISPGSAPISSATCSREALIALRERRPETWMLHVMDIGFLEDTAGHPRGAYRRDPDTVYLDFQRAIGASMIDQYLADNPLTMAAHGYEGDVPRTATTGAERIVLDGL